jgi:hypothetical protein
MPRLRISILADEGVSWNVNIESKHVDWQVEHGFQVLIKLVTRNLQGLLETVA